MKVPSVSIEELVEFIGQPTEAWRGNCSWVADRLLNSGLLQGRWAHQYGLWFGPVAATSRPFGGRTVTHHAWLRRVKDGLLCDPTRWVFEDVEPYVWFGQDDEGYDFGSNRLRRATMGECPAFDAAQVGFILIFPVRAHAEWVATHTRVPVQEAGGACFHLTVSLNQLFWIANAPLDLLGRHARPVYEELVRLKLPALIPIDNRRSVLPKI